MTKEAQVSALAELDGAKFHVDDLTSYDAIIPLIQKQEVGVRARVVQRHPSGVTLMSTPAQLCEALLRATGKWKE